MSLAASLDEALSRGSKVLFGELILSRSETGLFEARHQADLELSPDTLEMIESPRELRELSKYDSTGDYRPLKSAPSLRRGWRTETDSPQEFLKRLEAIYPAGLSTWFYYQEEGLEPISLRGTLERQTGMYQRARLISDQDAEQIAHECSDACLRKILWPIDASASKPPLEENGAEWPLLCIEACTFAVNRARELAKKADDSSDKS